MKNTSKILLCAGAVVCSLLCPTHARAQSAVWAGGSGNWFGGGSNWVCVSGSTTTPCTPPNGSGFTATIGTLLNGSPITGTVNADGRLNLSQLAVGTGATGSLTISTAAAGSSANLVTIGKQGTMTVSGGGTLGSSTLTNNGSIIATGAGSMLTGASLNFAGGTGSLQLENGGSAGYGFLVSIGGAGGTATVTGAGSNMTSGNNIAVGGTTSGESGTMTVQNGGTASATYGQVGGYTGTAGTATVTGSGSKWVVNQTLSVGTSGGQGTLNILNGGQVGPGIQSTGLSTQVGSGSGSKGTVLVSGGYLNTDGLTIGGNGGTGTMTVANGGNVSAYGFVTVANQGTLALNSGTFAVGRGFTLDSGGALNFGIGGATDYALLNLSNDIGTFNGTIDFDFMNGFAPAAGQTFNLIYSNGATDNFSGATFAVGGLAAGFQYTFLNEPQGLELEALNNGVSLTGSSAPEPASLWMVGAGILMGLGFMLRSRFSNAEAAPCSSRHRAL